MQFSVVPSWTGIPFRTRPSQTSIPFIVFRLTFSGPSASLCRTSSALFLISVSVFLVSSTVPIIFPSLKMAPIILTVCRAFALFGILYQTSRPLTPTVSKTSSTWISRKNLNIWTLSERLDKMLISCLFLLLLVLFWPTSLLVFPTNTGRSRTIFSKILRTSTSKIWIRVSMSVSKPPF